MIGSCGFPGFLLKRYIQCQKAEADLVYELTCQAICPTGAIEEVRRLCRETTVNHARAIRVVRSRLVCHGSATEEHCSKCWKLWLDRRAYR